MPSKQMLLFNRAYSVNIEQFITEWDRNSPQYVATSLPFFMHMMSFILKLGEKAFFNRLLSKELCNSFQLMTDTVLCIHMNKC